MSQQWPCRLLNTEEGELVLHPHGRAIPTPHHGHLFQMAWPRRTGSGSCLRKRSQWTLTSSATTQTLILGFGVAHLNIYLIYDLLERVNGLVLRSNNHRIPMTEGNSRIAQFQ